jgi:hypothetical protein
MFEDATTPYRPPVPNTQTPRKQLTSAFARITTPIGTQHGALHPGRTPPTRSHSAKRSLSAELDRLASPPTATSKFRRLPRYKFSLQQGFCVSPESLPWRRLAPPTEDTGSAENTALDQNDQQVSPVTLKSVSTALLSNFHTQTLAFARRDSGKDTLQTSQVCYVHSARLLPPRRSVMCGKFWPESCSIVISRWFNPSLYSSQELTIALRVCSIQSSTCAMHIPCPPSVWSVPYQKSQHSEPSATHCFASGSMVNHL